MSAADAFLQAVLDAPDDDAPRLVFADWLDEHGDAARAAFIRLQCELPRLRPDDPRRLLLAARERALLLAHGAEWVAAVRPLVGGWEFRRGFVEAVTLTPEAFARSADRLFRAAPVRRVRLVQNYGDDWRWEFPPQGARLTGLDVTGSICGETQLEALAGSPHLAGLRELHVRRGGLRGRGPAALQRAPFLERLTALHVAGPVEDARQGLGPLLSSPRLGGLTRLDLSGGGATTPLALANSAVVRTEMSAAADSPHLTRLTELRVAGLNLRPESLRLLGAARGLWRLEALDLGGNGLDYGAAAVLADAPLLSRLQILDLRGNRLEDAGVLALAESPHLGRLTALDLGGNGVGRGGARALAAARSLARLKALGLRGNRLGDGGLPALAGAAGLPALAALDLSYNRISPDGVRALAAAPPGRLAALDLSWNPFGDAAARALADAAGLEDLAFLDLSYAEVGDGGAGALAESANLPALAGLNLATNRVGDAGARALAESPHLPRLTTLSLAYNAVGADGARALAASPLFRRQTALDLTGNAVPAEMLAELRRAFRGCLGG
jgi:uncharacterized protein (TIGR02996 family)